MFARCPACQTVFRVQPEQLRAHRGEVRCGRCYASFNALDRVLHVAPAVSAPTPTAISQPPAAAAPRPVESVPERDDRFFILDDLPSAPEVTRQGADDRTEFEARDHREPVVPRDGHFSSATDATAAEGHPVPPIRRTRVVGIAPTPLDAPAAPASAALPKRQDDEPLTASASSRAGATDAAHDREHLDATYGPPASSGRRWLSGLGVGMLLGTLAVQSAFVFRDDITRKWPQLRPAYLSACAHLKCTLPLPRLAGAISIEASELQSEPGRVARFVLNATIRNRAPHPQAYPHLELTLTDVQDQPLVRRVLGPAQWLPAGFLEQGSAEQKFDTGRDIVVQLPFEAPGVEATGYRVYAFYP
ncbi:DUF3426 domain-containing protein [Aromatoleum aromaticum]|uniref:DUF3426 domain-containing protein n=1 Tax=Aromatoleum aromaticum TaxID=551760 RepID=UPI00145938D5|nr:DUF3426 domain-containing protein [Aromatoleum aromaticum]NMG54263.1 DUF3426 domain-containing protein [Aromatoleum aromaticum]